MTRAGREPAEDLKRRIVAACQEVGLRKDRAWARLATDWSGVDRRLIWVTASPEDWPSVDLSIPPHYSTEHSLVTIQTTMEVSGDWPGTVQSFCSTADSEAGAGEYFYAPSVHGRNEVPLKGLVAALRDTLEERKEVLAALRDGKEPPFRFANTVWKVSDAAGG